LFRNLLRYFPWYSAFVVGAGTGCAMAVFGVAVRVENSIPRSVLADWFGVPFFSAMGLSAARIGWMLVLEGVFLVAAMCAAAVRNHWEWWSAATAGLIAVVFFPGGTLAGMIVLLALCVRLIREKPWKRVTARPAAQR
jgi:hypothetical protein